MPEPMVRFLRSTAELKAFVPTWVGLWHRDPHATPFQHPAWLLPWWRHFGEPADDPSADTASRQTARKLSAVVLLSATGQPIGFLPFYLYPEPSTGERKVLLLGVGTSDYLDGLFDPACSVADIQAGLRSLYAEAGFDALYASQLRPESLLAQAFRGSAEADVRGFPTDSCGRMPALPIAGLPVKIRRNALYYRNRAQRLGELTYTLADTSTCQASFADLQRLHTERWQARGEPGVLADPAVLASHREALPWLAAADLLRLGTLRLKDEVLAVLYSLVDPQNSAGHLHRAQYFYLTAFSSAHAELRPGTLLLAFAIEHAAKEGVQTIDMLRGEEAYKEFWHLERTPTFGFNLSAPPLARAPNPPDPCQ